MSPTRALKLALLLSAVLIPMKRVLAQESTATFHQDCNYRGYGVALDVGSYDLAALNARGIRNDDLSSLRVFNGYKVTLYADAGFTGKSTVYTKNSACLSNAGWNDIVSSLKIEKVDVSTSGNPVFRGWYADPEVRLFGDTYWVFPTYSAGYDQQTFLDAFSSPDLVHWTKRSKVLDKANVSWARGAIWAPSAVEKGGKYYLFFGANDLQSDSDTGGIGVAVADRPEGPFVDLLGHPLIGAYHNGAQPIDQFVFQDVDGQYYMYYGGHSRCNVVKLNDSFTGIVPFPDGTLYKEVTPQGYVEGSFMFVRNGKYYFMWSEGNWTGPDYRVAYAIADGPTGPFQRIGTVLQQDPTIANGAGHHSVIKAPGEDKWFIVYHRRPLDQTDGNSREVAIDRIAFDANGYIVPVVLTTTGVPAQPAKYGALSGEYFNGMNFNTSVLTRADAAIDFNWANGSPANGVKADGFSVRWRGQVVPKYSETYTFFLNTDNGRRLWVNDQLVVDRWVDDWNVEYSGSIKLEAGKAYKLKMEYFENYGGASAKLEWSSPSQARQVVRDFKP